MRVLRALISPAVLCVVAVFASIGFSIVSSNASRTIVFKQETKFGEAKASFPMEMKRWDEPLFNLLNARAKADMADFLKNAEQEAAGRPEDSDAVWKPHDQTVTYLEQFRTNNFVSYLQMTTVVQGDGPPSVTFSTINYDKALRREFGLGDILEGAEDRSRTLEALSNYAREDLKEKTGEDEESDALLDLSKPDLSVYERFTLCPSTKIGKAAGLTIHFPPDAGGAYAGSEFHVTIPYTVFAKYLKPGMKALFSGEPRQAPVSWENADT
jgi:hypothetical protein